MKKTAILVAFCLASMALAWAAPAESTTFLPGEFAGWRLSGTPAVSHDPAQADPAFGPLLKEYGFQEMEQATYIRPDNRIMKVKAARFADASGAFGAFSFYKQPEMPKEDIGDQAASANGRVLFLRGNIVVDAVLDRVTAMSAAELRDLAASLPLPAGSARDLPPVLGYLPKQARRANSIRYFMGAVGLSDVSSPIPPQVVDFAKAIDAALHTTSRPEDPASRVKRSGPLVALVSGQISNSDAKSLLDQVNYDADITWNQNTFFSKRNNLGNLLVGVILLVAILIGFSLVAGLLFGGFRVLMKRLFPDRLFDRSKDVEIISLKLRDWR